MTTKVLNRIMDGARTPEGKVIALLVAFCLSFMTWNVAALSYAADPAESDQVDVVIQDELVSDVPETHQVDASNGDSLEANEVADENSADETADETDEVEKTAEDKDGETTQPSDSSTQDEAAPVDLAELNEEPVSDATAENGTTFKVVYCDEDGVTELASYDVKAGEATPSYTPGSGNQRVFSKWAPEVTDTVNGDVKYYAEWLSDLNSNGIADAEETTYTVTYRYEGNYPEYVPSCPTAQTEVLPGIALSVAEKPANQTTLAFVGWTSDEVTVNNGSFTMPAQDVVFTGAWRVDLNGSGIADDEEMFTVVYDLDGGATTSEVLSFTNLRLNDKIPAIEAPTKDDSIFKGWKNNVSKNTRVIASLADENSRITCKAVWLDDKNGNGVNDKKDKFKVVYDLDGGTTTSVETSFSGLNANAEVPTIENPTKDDFVFAGWSPNASDSVDAAAAKNSTDKLTITYAAIWKDDKNHNGVADEEEYRTITYTDGVEGIVAFADQVYEKLFDGSATPVFAGQTDRAGYLFTNWSPAVAETVNGDATYIAAWEADFSALDADGIVKGFTVEYDGAAHAVEFDYDAVLDSDVVTFTYTDVNGQQVVSDNPVVITNVDESTAVTVTVDRGGSIWTKSVQATITPKPIPVAEPTEGTEDNGDKAVDESETTQPATEGAAGESAAVPSDETTEPEAEVEPESEPAGEGVDVQTSDASTLTIGYTYPDGAQVAEPVVLQVAPGETYEVALPIIPGYTAVDANGNPISSLTGVMTDDDLNVSVNYMAIPDAVVPAAAPAPAAPAAASAAAPVAPAPAGAVAPVAAAVPAAVSAASGAAPAATVTIDDDGNPLVESIDDGENALSSGADVEDSAGLPLGSVIPAILIAAVAAFAIFALLRRKKGDEGNVA